MSWSSKGMLHYLTTFDSQNPLFNAERPAQAEGRCNLVHTRRSFRHPADSAGISSSTLSFSLRVSSAASVSSTKEPAEMQTAGFVCFFTVFLLPTASALSSDGTVLMSLLTHWNVIPPSIRSTWNASFPSHCSWVGVYCRRLNFVFHLNLSGLGISGQLGPEIANLRHLRTIDISFNRFSGPIPSELGHCGHLLELDLSKNSFSGAIPPSLGNLQRLEFLSLWDNSLTGKIPISLFNIQSLKELHLSSNSLSGSIPAEIGNLTALEVLHLDSNMLSGWIPATFGNCTALQELYLNNNLLDGALPDTLNNLEELAVLYVNDNNLEGRIQFGAGSCKQLQILVLSNNHFNGGLPPGLGNCSSLNTLAAVNCSLNGHLPSSLGQLTQLKLLYLPENQFSGSIPPELGNCKAMTDLQMYDNQLEGVIPSELGMLSQLQILMLFKNNLSGEIPIGIWKIQNLQHLLVYQNNLVGEIPEEIIQLKQLRNISLFDNHFTGVIPQGLGINTSLTQIDLTRNRFRGPIPPNLCFQKQLRKLLLAQNEFEGSIPPDIGSCSTLTRLILKGNNLKGMLPEFVRNSTLLYMDLSNNSLTGSIPASLGNLKHISSLDLSMNMFTGDITNEIGNLVNLESLNLSNNKLEGVLPSNLSKCYKLSKLDLRRNLLNGTIPSSWGSLKELSSLDISENSLLGDIPRFLFQFEKLVSIQLGANRFTGELPNEIGNLRMLEQLGLSCNNLSGSIEVLSELHSLVEVNLSSNSFAGPVPSSLMKAFSPLSFIGNPGLCVQCHPVGSMNCNGYKAFKHCDSPTGGGLRQADIAMIVSGSFVFAAVVILGFSFVALRKNMDKELHLAAVEEGDSSLLNQVMEATEYLSDGHIIGRGAHGVVYKVSMDQGQVYALKKVSFGGCKEGHISFCTEVQTIGNVRHRNLVRLEAFWLRKEYGLLLYSYMANGSLDKALHEKHPTGIGWRIRFKIALGTSQGLSYLHFDCNPPIIHKDIKPMNILLDSEFEPHIADFGIARMLDDRGASSVVQGTLGYIAPENAFCARSSKESDVYAYGVVLLELVTGRRALDSSFGGEMDIVQWVNTSLSSGSEVVVDPEIGDECIDSNIIDEIQGVLSIALSCTAADPNVRPNMREVTNKLLRIDSTSRRKHLLLDSNETTNMI